MADKILSVAPMMAWTDRHCRYLHRLYAPHALLFTEMVTTGALIHGQQWHQLDFNPEEHPVALQLGGNNPKELAICAREAQARGYDEVNLNVGCPSDRVRQGAFGACLMLDPQLVADCVAAMRDVVSIPVSVKCRLGVDDQDSDPLLHQFMAKLAKAGTQRIYLHARKAILAGLSPAQNRDIPPLQPERVKLAKTTFPHLSIVINGGITDATQVENYLAWADGVMIGRAAYHNPDLLSACEQMLFTPEHTPDKADILERYIDYVSRSLAQGERLHSMTRHLLSSCNGQPGARQFRRTLSDAKRLKQGDVSIITEALSHVHPKAA
jgi:tRNA-dihydrouridine synthase A